MSASKSFNIAGLKTAFAIIPDAGLRKCFEAARGGMVDSVNLMGLEASRAAFRHGESWLQGVAAYLERNRNHLARELRRRFPAIGFNPPSASFLAWLDCRALELPADPQTFFLNEALVGLSAGEEFGPGGVGHVRLNFGCPRATLDEALDRLEGALRRRR